LWYLGLIEQIDKNNDILYFYEYSIIIVRLVTNN